MLVTPSRIVAATDFSDDAANAVRRAAMLARRHGTELELLHVISRSSLDAVREWVREPADCADRLVEDTRRILEEAAPSTGTPTSARLVLGEVLEEISSSCAPGRILVAGARGLNPLRDAIIGTTAERLVGRCECPILVVRKSPQEDYRRGLVGLDLHLPIVLLRRRCWSRSICCRVRRTRSRLLSPSPPACRWRPCMRSTCHSKGRYSAQAAPCERSIGIAPPFWARRSRRCAA